MEKGDGGCARDDIFLCRQQGKDGVLPLLRCRRCQLCCHGQMRCAVCDGHALSVHTCEADGIACPTHRKEICKIF